MCADQEDKYKVASGDEPIEPSFFESPKRLVMVDMQCQFCNVQKTELYACDLDPIRFGMFGWVRCEKDECTEKMEACRAYLLQKNPGK